MAAKEPGRMMRLLKKMPPSTLIKLGGVAVAVVVTLLPLFFWPSNNLGADADGEPQTYITVPPVAVVTSVLPAGETTTTLASQATDTTIEAADSITIAAVGDIIIHPSVLESAYDPTTNAYDFTNIFAPVAPFLAAADYTVVDLESRMAGGTISESNDSVTFNAPYSLTDSFVEAGVDLVATANNHSADFGWLGITRTLERLDYAGIAHVGTARTPGESETPLVADIRGIKVGFINYTAFVNSDATVEGHEDYAINILDMEKAAEEAAAAREQGAEVVVALLHFGVEYLRTPTAQQTQIVEGTTGVGGLLSRGVDVILGAHPHVVQPIVRVIQYSGDRNATYAAYSLGNFLTGQRWRYTDSGIIAYVHIAKEDGEVTVTGISYLPVYVQKSTRAAVESGDEVTSDETTTTEATTTTDAATVGDELTAEEQVFTYRILPVLPGLTPQTDTVVTTEDRARMNQVWEELEKLLYRPDERIVPLDPGDLGF